MRYYCTYFDRHFLPRALALYHSLRQVNLQFHLWGLCHDEEAYAALRGLALPEFEPVSLAEFEAGDEALRAAKAGRSRVEYYFTCTPSLPLWVLDRHPEVDRITYLDADLWFFADPEPLFAELGEASIGIVPHRFAPRVADRARMGIYNVGWNSFRRDEAGLACLRWWRERCLEWCYNRVEGNRFADQKYLDDWPERFEGVHVVRHKGANLGPWNLANHRVTEREGALWVDDQPLLFYHFAGFVQLSPWAYNTNFASWHLRPTGVVRRRIFTPYVRALRAAEVGGRSHHDALPSQRSADRLRRLAGRLPRLAAGLANQQYLVVVKGRVL